MADGKGGRYGVDQEERRQVTYDLAGAYIRARGIGPPCPFAFPVSQQLPEPTVLKRQERINKEIKGRKPQRLRHDTQLSCLARQGTDFPEHPPICQIETIAKLWAAAGTISAFKKYGPSGMTPEGPLWRRASLRKRRTR